MDIVLIAAGAGLAFWGSRMKDPTGGRNGTGNSMLLIGAAVAVIGLIIFAIAFANGFSQGLEQSR